MSDSDTQSLIEEGELRLVEVPSLRRFGERSALKGVSVLAAVGCVVGAAVLVSRRGAGARPGELKDGALREGMTELAELTLAPPSVCAAYTDCATLPGECCPNAEGNMMGCCQSPRLDTAASTLNAALAQLGAAPGLIPGQCQDTFGWTNGYTKCSAKGYTASHGCMPTGLSCLAYDLFGWCANGAVVPGKEWTQGAGLESPELNCCGCGKPPNPPSNETVEAPQMIALSPVPAPPGALPSVSAEATQPTLGPPVLPTGDSLPANVTPPEPTSAPLGGGAAPNGTQGEPAAGECAASPGCVAANLQEGLCCPTADGTMLDCCSNLQAAAGPALLPAASGPGPLMTFYMYRVASDEDYPINGVNMANLAGDMWYLHNEVVQHCPRKFNMERLLRFKVTARATPVLFGQNGRNFDTYVAFDQAKCTVPNCAKLHWDLFGYVVGCQPNNIGQVAVPGSPTWYSLPGTCPSQFYYNKTEQCNLAEPGGACPTSAVTGTRNCTYYVERAGEIRLDELSGLQNYNKVCMNTGMLEYDESTDAGVGTKFWNGKTDAAAGFNRMQAVQDLFSEKFPDMPSDLDDPTCDV